jgi:hypothetical protein
MKQVLRAGEALAGDLPWTDETAEAVQEVFKIANNWRDSHAYPMRRMRYELLGQIRKLQLKGITAARLKRMQSIRSKLRKIRINLNQIQDLAGCRAILPTMKDVNLLIEALRQNSAHTLHSENNYINNPKPDGYRCHHMVFKFRGSGGDDVYDGRRVEVQIRTRLQHSWATAVEAVGLFRGEDIKGGQGNPEWRRLFELMSMEFAVAEGCIGSVDPLARKARVAEIKRLNASLQAANTLENLTQAVKFTDSYLLDPLSKPEYYLIQYDNISNVVHVEPYKGAILSVASYHNAELSDNRSGRDSINTVLVEVDKIENLKEAYPNYFGDVLLFKRNLKNITYGKDAKEYTLPRQETVRPAPRETPDLSWFTKRKRWQ